ncbi:IS1595 family transposase ISDbac1 [Methanimicrococcus hongohii]|uniref:IS1595 family transposase ISDbac1 n=1 Tax=Methanimicrococcus hongohii TaxID=3028295 RepID=A0AA96ZTV3_9EURY|nr:IS1595 family transposase [Methanimicrococcus sp. Hf6]WNY23107.1 IS1595 family transposase ISDbac1 [Methanimicrococcus sp. Hf6]
MKNKYIFRSKISEAKFRQIVKLFAFDLDATQISKITGISRITINRYLMAIRERIAEFCEQEAPFQGEIEVDESYFGPRRVKGKRGRGAGHKTIVFGIVKRQEKVYTRIVPDCSKSTLQKIIKEKVDLDSEINSDKWHGYNGLEDAGYKKHHRVDHGKDEFVNGKHHINGIEGFWGFSKTRMSKHRGVNKKYFYLHLKECEFRYNYRNEDLYQKILKIVRNNPLFLS